MYDETSLGAKIALEYRLLPIDFKKSQQESQPADQTNRFEILEEESDEQSEEDSDEAFPVFEDTVTISLTDLFQYNTFTDDSTIEIVQVHIYIYF